MLLERKEASLLEFLMILTLLNDSLYTVSFGKPTFTNISLYLPILKRLFLFLPCWYCVYHNSHTEQLLTHSSVPKKHPLSEQGAFLMP